MHVDLVTVNAAVSTICSTAHLWCTIHLDVFNNEMIAVQTLHSVHSSMTKSQ